MINYDSERTRQAVQHLVDTPYFAQHIRRIESHARDTGPLPFLGGTEVLNELITVGRQNSKALANLLLLVKNKRSNKNDYQREFMATKRRRDRKAIDFEEMILDRKLTPDERRKFLIKKYMEWSAQRERFLSTLGSVDWDYRNSELRSFWQTIENDMDEMTKHMTTVEA
jgi:hypothetical protein